MATMPHCDSNVLHAPEWGVVVSSLVANRGEGWTLYTHLIGQAPSALVSGSILPGSRAHMDTVTPVILLTQPASLALESVLRGTSSNQKDCEGVEKTVLNTQEDVARRVSVSGDSTTFQQKSAEPNWPLCSEKELPIAERLFESLKLNHVKIVIPVFRGTSWSLITGTENEGWMTAQLPDSSVRGTKKESKLNSLSAILSVLTAIAPELTFEQWQMEAARREVIPCEFCDMYPEWQELRILMKVNFTGENDPRREPCPSERNRPLSIIEQWGGNQKSVPDAKVKEVAKRLPELDLE